ncbi:hypothetical protein ISN76_19875 [Dyella halodurans]|uniref:Uncharacterized protein n=1 Tax=Dyella halodurans TaxID=1920171 RepID=A0ABV9BZT8_9GAMM|nr:hypothetical protein [Dyella halodurans]
MDLFEAKSSAGTHVEAATALESLLDQQRRNGLLQGDAKALAERLVSQVWAQKPELFEGRIGPQPHPIAIAAIALAAGARLEAYRNNDALRCSYTFALGLVLDDIATHAPAYSFQPVDHLLLDAAAATFAEPTADLQLSPLFESFGL